MGSLRKEEWESSYGRGENFIFFPKESVVKFLNRFVRKKVGPSTFRDVLDFRAGIRGLDYGCGIGRQTILMEEFGIEAYGLDISEGAIAAGRALAAQMGYAHVGPRLSVAEGKTIPFEDGFFDLTISDSVLDSMAFETARELMSEIDRVTKRLAFITLISGDDGSGKHAAREETVATTHEQGTIQSYFDQGKIDRLLAGTAFRIKWLQRVTEEYLYPDARRAGRFFVVLEKPA
jgi:SAM-dependent methyltransferase